MSITASFSQLGNVLIPDITIISPALFNEMPSFPAFSIANLTLEIEVLPKPSELTLE